MLMELIRSISDHDVAMYLNKRRSRRVSRFVLTLILVYGVFCVAMMLGQRVLMYFPEKTTFDPEIWGLSELTPLRTVTTDGVTITSWYRPPRDLAKPTIAFMQGNAGHAGQRNYKVLPWLDAGYGVVMIGYRGFGMNQGTPTEHGLYRDARSVLNELQTRGVTGQALLLYGESLGTGIAVQMATEFPAAGLVLESPYSSTTDVGSWRYPFLPVRYLMWDRFDSIGKIGQVHIPLLLAHGEADATIPVHFGKKLFEAANAPKQGIFVPGLGHSTIYSADVQNEIMRFYARMPHDRIVNGRLGEQSGSSKPGQSTMPHD
ncbi:MAG: alpha/beta hydrolase [Alphaproteobacteria bacterium]